MIDREYLKDAASSLQQKLPDNHGFLLLTIPFNTTGDANRVAYISNVKREDAVKALKEFLFRIGEGENWMQHIK